MTAKNLSTVATELIATSGKTAQNVITAYRAGGERMVDLLEQRWNSALRQSRSELSAETARNASAAQLAFSALYTKGLIFSAEGAQQIVQQLVKVAEAGIERASANASLFEEKTGVNTLNSLARASAPGALVLSKLADKVEEQTALLASKLAEPGKGNQRSSAFRQRRTARAA
jgi:murein L,D-transpeptidase YcbB/YkuD